MGHTLLVNMLDLYNFEFGKRFKAKTLAGKNREIDGNILKFRTWRSQRCYVLNGPFATLCYTYIEIYVCINLIDSVCKID